jgi:hypothetical protein
MRGVLTRKREADEEHEGIEFLKTLQAENGLNVFIFDCYFPPPALPRIPASALDPGGIFV